MKRNRKHPGTIKHAGKTYVLDREATVWLRRKAEKSRFDQPDWFGEEAKDIVRSVMEDYPEDVDRETALHESVDGAVPVYYTDLVDLLRYTDIGHRKVEEGMHDGTAFNLLQTATYDELYEKAAELLEDYEPEEEDED